MESSRVYVSDLRKQYDGGFVAVKNVSFEVEESEVLGIIGPNGAGKTSTLKMISGLIEPSGGTAEVAGFSVEDPEMRTKLGFLPEESPAYDSMTARSYLRFFADLYDVPRKKANERIESTLDELELEYRDRPIGDLSKGMTRKVLVARSLINDPDVLVYDEPASGLDPYTTNYIVDYIDELASRGKSIVFSAHNLYHVESLCDRVLIIDNGKVLANGTIPSVRKDHGSLQYDVLTDEPLPGSELTDDGYRKRVSTNKEVQEIKQEAGNNGIEVKDVYTVEPSLEDIFLDMIQKGDSE